IAFEPTAKFLTKSLVRLAELEIHGFLRIVSMRRASPASLLRNALKRATRTEHDLVIKAN
ncbi:MAG: hypothetical protein ACREQD_15930, partial [Candidatus Binataceae bacterium]